MSSLALDSAARWWDWIAPLAVQATLLGAFALLVDRPRLRRSRPELASAAWLVFFARMLLPPSLSSPIAIAPSELAAVSAPLAGGSKALAAAWGLWLAVAGALLVRSLSATRLFERSLALDFDLPRRLAHEAALARQRLGLRRMPRIAIAERLESPAVVGLFRPLVLVPRGLVRGGRRALSHALLHEFAHVRRGDLIARAVVECVTACFWFHPLAWIGAARLARARELLCDAAVLDALGDERAGYRESLLLAARERLFRPSSSALAFHAGPSRILERLACLERRCAHPTRRKLASLALCIAGACALSPMASRQAELAAAARSVFAAQARGERQSCFVLHAATIALAADPSPSADQLGD